MGWPAFAPSSGACRKLLRRRPSPTWLHPQPLPPPGVTRNPYPGSQEGLPPSGCHRPDPAGPGLLLSGLRPPALAALARLEAAASGRRVNPLLPGPSQPARAVRSKLSSSESEESSPSEPPASNSPGMCSIGSSHARGMPGPAYPRTCWRRGCSSSSDPLDSPASGWSGLVESACVPRTEAPAAEAGG